VFAEVSSGGPEIRGDEGMDYMKLKQEIEASCQQSAEN